MAPAFDIFQAHVAQAAIGASTVRGQGNAGVAPAARRFLARLDLQMFSVKEESAFLTVLDAATDDLVLSLPETARHWGIARKCVNIFLRDAFYNRFIFQPLLPCEDWFEVPLDGIVADKLRRRDSLLPKWLGVKGVTPALSFSYQKSAVGLAQERGFARVYLDSEIWGGRAGRA